MNLFGFRSCGVVAPVAILPVAWMIGGQRRLLPVVLSMLVWSGLWSLGSLVLSVLLMSILLLLDVLSLAVSMPSSQ